MRRHLKDYFVPHEGNDYAPHSLQKFAVGTMAFLALLTFAIANLQSILWVSSEWMVSTILPAVVVEETNSERSAEALGAVTRSSVLDRAAQLKAEHMAAGQYFSHYSPDGISPWYWFGQVGYSFVHAGENLAVHFTDSGELVDAWMASPTHRANILNGDYQEIGIGTAKGTYEGFETVFVVQLFGTPAAPAPAPVASEPAPVVAGAADSPMSPSTTTPVVASDLNLLPDQDTETSTETDTSVVTSDSSEITAGDDAAITETVDRTTPPVAMTQMVTTTPTAPESPAPVAFTEPTSGDVYLSGFISTTTGALPASIDPTSEASSPDVGFFARLGTQPQTVLQALYAFLALLVVIALLLSVVIEIRRQQPVQIAYALCLLFLMGGLWFTHVALTGVGVIM